MDDLSQLHPHGMFLRREALAMGYRDRDLSRAVREGTLQRVRHGTYTSGEVWTTLEPVERHLLRARACPSPMPIAWR